jgi:hypothetical protein
LYHINFGGDLLDAGAKVVVPAKTVVPRDPRAAEGIGTWDQYADPEPGFAEQVYLFELAADSRQRTRVLLRNAAGTLGACLGFGVDELPCFTLWKNTAALGDGYVTGLEPGTNFPNPRSHESVQGRILRLAPGESRKFDLSIQLHSDAGSVAKAERRIATLQPGAPQVHDQPPQAGWCASVS